MKIALDDKNYLIQNGYFPKRFENSKKANEVIIGVGANIKNEQRRFKKLVNYLLKDKHISLHRTSPLFSNPPFGFLEQSQFLNAIFYISTDLSPSTLMRYLLHIEKHFGRKRSFENAPRKLDLDIIFYKNAKIRTKKLTVPHKSYYKRESVLVPLVFLDVR